MGILIDLKKHMNKDLSGSFWLPEVNIVRDGHLNFNEKSITITVSEDLYGDLYPSLKKEVSQDRLEAVYGEVEGLGKVTFFDSFQSKMNFNGIQGGRLFVSQTIYSSAILVGANTDRREAVEFNKVTFSFEGLDEWVDGISGIKEMITTTKPIEINLTYKFPPLQKFELEEGDKLLSIETNLQYKREIREARFVESVRLGLSKKNEGTPYGGLTDAIVDICRLRDLLSLFIGKRVTIGDIRLTNYNANTDIYEPECQYFIRTFATETAKIERSDIFILFSGVKDEFGVILQKWARFEEKNSHILREIFNAYLNIKGSIYSKFLSYSKIVEALHRNIDDSSPFNDQQIKEIDSINKEIKNLTSKYDDKVKKRYSEMILGVNRHTLQERLESLFDRFLSDGIRTSLSAGSDFVTDVKKMRNDLTHLNKDVNDLDPQELYDASSKLKTMVHIIIFKSIGLTDELLLRCLGTIQRSRV